MVKYVYGDEIGSVSFVDAMGDDKRSALAARVSLLNDDFDAIADDLTDKDKKLISFLAEHRHTSPFEHSSYSVRIVCPIFVSKQIMRHRTFSFNEVSRRYTSENIQFFIPQELRQQAVKNLQCSTGDEVESGDEALAIYRSAVDSALASYNELLDGGVCREQARAVLPQALYTEFYMTGNILNFVKFLKLRLHAHAQPEVQVIAQAILDMISEDFPFTMSVFFDED